MGDELDTIIGQVQARVVELEHNAADLREVCRVVEKVVATLPRGKVTPRAVSEIIDAPPPPTPRKATRKGAT